MSSLAAALVLSSLLVAPSLVRADDAEPVKIDVFGKGTLMVPPEFQPTEPASRIIEREFKVGEGDDTARLTMMRAGGGVAPNIKRWKGQFSGGAEAEQKTEKMDVGPFEVHVVDFSGTYAERMGGGPFFGGKVVQRENYAMAGAILVSPDGPMYFLKMIGPAKVVKSNREKFVEMVKSVGK
jgi:hypothetical protein